MTQTVYRILGKRGRITIPFDIRKRMNFAYNDVLSFTEAEDGKTITVKRERICDGCYEKCHSETPGSVTLEEFLDDLSPKEQRAALIYLSVKWAELQSGKERNNED